MGLYPVCIELARRPCLVVGGGRVAEGKVQGLLAAGADVTVVSPTLTATLEALAEGSRVRHRARRYDPGDLAGCVLAFAATGDPAVSAAVQADGRRLGVPVNAADDPAHCDFILPAVVRRGGLTVAVSTGGASPAVARAVREELERHLGDQHAALVAVAGEVRRDLRQAASARDAAAWRRALADGTFRTLIARGDRASARRRLRAALDVA